MGSPVVVRLLEMMESVFVLWWRSVGVHVEVHGR